MQRRIQSIVRPVEAGQTVIEFLAGRFTYHARDAWLARVANGQVSVNGHPAEPERVLVTGDVVGYRAHDVPEPNVNLDFRVVHDDADLLIIDKPPNLPCHPGGRYFDHTLWAEVRRRSGIEAPAFVNRLDRETSGLVVVARNPRAARICARQFAQHRVIKRYVTVVEGHFPASLSAAGLMVPDPIAGVHKRWRFHPLSPEAAPRPEDATLDRAVTDFRGLACREGLSAVEAIPRTGRHHQIRATLLALGFPVVGDKVYGPDPLMFVRFCSDALTDDDWRRLRLKRQALHASHLEFRHPDGGALLQCHAPVPEDMCRLIPDWDASGNRL